MRPRTRLAAVLLAGAFLSTTSVEAHHSIANFWDATKTISVKGLVKTVKLVNPHSEITLEVMEDGKPVKWVAFGLGITDLRRRGITSEMLLGKNITLEGNPPKKAAGKGVFIANIILEDGTKMNIRELDAFR